MKKSLLGLIIGGLLLATAGLMAVVPVYAQEDLSYRTWVSSSPQELPPSSTFPVWKPYSSLTQVTETIDFTNLIPIDPTPRTYQATAGQHYYVFVQFKYKDQESVIFTRRVLYQPSTTETTPTATNTPGPGTPPPPPQLPTQLPTATPIPSTPSATFTIKLTRGWNLISIPRALEDPSVTSVFTGYADRVYYGNEGTPGGWDSAVLLNAAWTGNLQTIEEGKGYWVSAIADVDMVLKLAPNDPTKPPPSYLLQAGWNMIGYTSRGLISSRTLSEYLRSLNNNWISVYRYSADAGFELGKPDGSGDFTQVELGRGYWIHLNQATTLTP